MNQPALMKGKSSTNAYQPGSRRGTIKPNLDKDQLEDSTPYQPGQRRNTIVQSAKGLEKEQPGGIKRTKYNPGLHKN
jgi:hypothetical protein